MTKLEQGVRSWGRVSEVGAGCPKLGHTTLPGNDEEECDDEYGRRGGGDGHRSTLKYRVSS